MSGRKTKHKALKDFYRTKIDVRVPFATKKLLQEKAKEHGISLSDLLRFYIERSIKEDIRCNP
jgi:predicted HicB family RNase H-like nuclease